jgi:hypothetical protein
MKIIIRVLVAMAVATPTAAQDRSKEPLPQGTSDKTVSSCRVDIQKYCNSVTLKQECLVAHWSHISGDCQDALATPMRSGGDGG